MPTEMNMSRLSRETTIVFVVLSSFLVIRTQSAIPGGPTDFFNICCKQYLVRILLYTCLSLGGPTTVEYWH